MYQSSAYRLVQVLGIPADTPLADVLPSVIMKAAKPHYASILTEAAVKARSMATATQSTQLQAPRLQATQGQSYGRAFQGLPFPRPPNQHRQRAMPDMSPESICASLETAISNLKLPTQLMDHVRFTGQEGNTGSGNFRMDFMDWSFGKWGYPGPLPPNATNMLEVLFREVPELDAQGVQLMTYTVPFMVRITSVTPVFPNEQD